MLFYLVCVRVCVYVLSNRVVETGAPVKPLYEVTSTDLEIERFGNSGFESIPTDRNRESYTVEELRLRLTRVVRRGDAPTMCYVERDRSGLNRLNPVYRWRSML